MTDDELAAIRARAEAARAEAARAATEGPTLSDQLAAWFDDGPRKMADSQRDVSVLLAEVDRLRARLVEHHSTTAFHIIAEADAAFQRGEWQSVCPICVPATV